MLVALALFALVGLASFSVLDAVIRARDRTEGRLERIAALDRALILVGRDLGQSDPGSQRLEGGALSFALLGAGGPGTMRYALVEGALERRAGEGEGAVAQRLAEGLSLVGWRALDGGGAWRDAWPPDEADPAPLRGIELSLTLAEGPEGATIRRLVELPKGVPP